MVQNLQNDFKNCFLRRLSPADLKIIRDQLEPIDLPVRFELEPANRPISHVYFLEEGLASVVARSSNSHESEVALIGADGWTGVTVALGCTQTPNRTFMQLAGSGHRISTDLFRSALRQSESFTAMTHQFVQLFIVQLSQTAVVNAHARLEERLARWLLMASDRIGGGTLALTHEFLGYMLGVRRAGVSIAVQELARNGVLGRRRGVLIINDRESLVRIANGFYGVPEREAARLKAKPDPRRGKLV